MKLRKKNDNDKTTIQFTERNSLTEGRIIFIEAQTSEKALNILEKIQNYGKQNVKPCEKVRS